MVGSHLLYYLLKDNDSVRAIHRKGSDLLAVKEVFAYYTENSEKIFNRIEWWEADITEIPSLTEAFIGVTHVYHAAAYISFDPKHYYKLKKANIEGTANVVNLCLSKKVKKLCYVSSIATLGKSENGELVAENNEWNPEENNSVYGITKYGAEMEVWRGTQEGLDSVIVLPGVILGSGHWSSGSGIIFKSVAKGIPFYTSGGIGIVDVQDVVKIMISLMMSPIRSERYVLISKNILYKELFSEVAIHLNRRPPKKKAKKWMLLILSKLDWTSNKIFGTRRSLIKSTVLSLYKRSNYDASKIERELDFSFTPYKQTLERVAKNYLNCL